jgi:hypothetical protein
MSDKPRSFWKRFAAAGEIDPRAALFLLVFASILIAGTMFNSGSAPKPNLLTTITVAPQEVTTPSPQVNQDIIEPTKTPLPEEYLSNQQQTIGLTLAAAALVLVVVVGVMYAFMRQAEG